MVLVCIPFFLLILSLTRTFMAAARKVGSVVKAGYNNVAHRLAPVASIILPHTPEAGKHHPRRHQRSGGTGAAGPHGGVKRTQSMLYQQHEVGANEGKWSWRNLKLSHLRWRPWANGTTVTVVEGTAPRGKDSDTIV